MTENNNQTRSNRQEQVLNLDDVLATQPELGPSIPDGGFGWVVFLGTLFFQVSESFITTKWRKIRLCSRHHLNNITHTPKFHFQALIPCLLVNFGVFLAFCKLENRTYEDKNMYLWEEKILYVPLFFCIARSFFGKRNFPNLDDLVNHIPKTLLTPFLE